MNLYFDCVNYMSENKEVKNDISDLSKEYKGDVSKVNQKVQNISETIRSQQIRYKRFDNYKRKWDL